MTSGRRRRTSGRWNQAPGLAPATGLERSSLLSCRCRHWNAIQIASVSLGKIFVEAGAPVAHDVEPTQVELGRQQPLRGRPRREIFLREMLRRNRVDLHLGFEA